jgi:hypothetical protein
MMRPRPDTTGSTGSTGSTGTTGLTYGSASGKDNL